jgi:hypothetical protein
MRATNQVGDGRPVGVPSLWMIVNITKSRVCLRPARRDIIAHLEYIYFLESGLFGS